MPLLSPWFLTAVLGCLLGQPTSGSASEGPLGEPRPRLELNGTWDFRVDPKGEGAASRWFEAGVPYPDRIRVPGTWQAQGFGPEWRRLRHNYQGKAWYRRAARVPGRAPLAGERSGAPADWAGKRLWLHLGGTANTAQVFVNGRNVGSVEGYLTPYEFDVTDAIRLGEANVIACCVDSTGPAPVGTFNLIGRWGGLYRGVFLEARPATRIDDLFVMPDVQHRTARTRVALARTPAAGAWEGEVLVRVQAATGGQACEGRGRVAFARDKPESEPCTVDIPISDMHAWSPEDPFLYNVSVALLDGGKVVDAVRDRFGMRQFTVGEGGRLLLNGKPYFVRGIGDDTVEVLTGTQSTDKQVHVRRIEQAKRYGFNGTRFLANVPIREYFEAADEAGFLVMCEGAIYHKPKECIPLLKKQAERIARAYRNHPSWYIWSSGNELFECQGAAPDPDWMDYIRAAHEAFKRLDPTRLFVASDGADVFPTDIITQAAKFSPFSGTYDQPFDGAVDEVAYFKRVLSDAEMTALAQPAAGYAERVRALQPSGYWRLDETGPGKAADSSGTGNHGSYEGGMRKEDFQAPGALAPHDGNAAIATGPGGRSVSLRNAAARAFATGNQPFSLSLWARPSGFRQGDWGTMFSCGTAQTGAALLVALDGEKGSGRIVLGTWMSNLPPSQASLLAGRWNHIGICYDGASLRLFLNGALDSTLKVKLGAEPADGRIGNLIQARNEDVPRYQSRPHIWHEFDNTYVGPHIDLELADRLTGVFRDHECLSLHRRQIEELGLASRYADARQRSIDLFCLHLKRAFEAARASATLDGYGYWCMTDYPGDAEGDQTTYGLFNILYEPDKFPDPAALLEFNRETVLLADVGPDSSVLAAGDVRPVRLSISHYGSEPIAQGRLTWDVAEGGRVRQRGVIEPVNAAVGYVGPLGEIRIGPLHPETALKLRLSVRLESPACQQRNHWDLWAFPAKAPLPEGTRVADRTEVGEIRGRYGAAVAADMRDARLVLASRMTRELLDYVAGGGTILLIAESERHALARPRAHTFWFPWIRSTGTLVERHPALAAFPHDGFCAYQFCRLFGNGLECADLTAPGSVERDKLSAMIWGLHQDADPARGKGWSELGARWKFYRTAILSEARIGRGKLLLCSLRLLSGVQRRLPEAGYLLDCLVAYAASDRFAPPAPPMTPDEARQVFTID